MQTEVPATDLLACRTPNPRRVERGTQVDSLGRTSYEEARKLFQREPVS